VTGALGSGSHELDELRRSRLGIEHARLHLAVLASVGDVFAASVDFAEALEALGDVLVPAFADAFVADLRQPGSADHRWVSGPAPGGPDDVGGSAHPHPDGDRLVERVISEGVTVTLMPGRGPAGSGASQTVPAAPAAGVESMVIVPVPGGGGPIGALSFVTGPERRGLRPSDVQTARAVAQRLAAAVERRRLLAQLRRSERLQAVAQLAAGVAHDFNNLLTVILGSSEDIERRLGTMPDAVPGRDELVEDVAAIERAGRRAAALTAQLLDLAAPAGATPEAFDPDEVVAGILPALGQLVGPGVVIEHQPARPPVRVLAERAGLERAILNLAANARDAMSDGGRLTIAVAALATTDTVGPVAVDVSTTVPTAVVSVADTGSGMDESTAQRCFEPFFTTKERFRGTGLGLAGVASFVAGAGGEVSVETAPGQGCTVNLRIPMAGPQGSKR
jgi:signal transduction histidine kinase